MARHQCKHLLGIVMEWLGPFDATELLAQSRRNTEFHERKMAWLNRSIQRYRSGDLAPDQDDPEPLAPEVFLPDDVATALNIYRYEEIERLKSGQAWKEADWSTGKARAVADGALDRIKQAALYVDISKTGEVGRYPGDITRAQAEEAIQAARKLAEGAAIASDEYQALREALLAI